LVHEGRWRHGQGNLAHPRSHHHARKRQRVEQRVGQIGQVQPASQVGVGDQRFVADQILFAPTREQQDVVPPKSFERIERARRRRGGVQDHAVAFVQVHPPFAVRVGELAVVDANLAQETFDRVVAAGGDRDPRNVPLGSVARQAGELVGQPGLATMPQYRPPGTAQASAWQAPASGAPVASGNVKAGVPAGLLGSCGMFAVGVTRPAF
jgi:hypothetical protein